ncbi:uncharacterized protein LOC118201628 isoform X2 [Stegodyphus dumicola]|uniref:uncharacterized protein LOC118201628 isoform X2 n=1 Tax=Stegodyphus dumicola TaxID=202533 RepID=UPI0015AA5A95|nr:uncharacterized protein LOC118201628 isoform X2 [Stegodyphus dumicola]
MVPWRHLVFVLATTAASAGQHGSLKMRLRRWSISACRSSHCGLRRRNSICCVDFLQIVALFPKRLTTPDDPHYGHKHLRLIQDNSDALPFNASTTCTDHHTIRR